MDLVDKAEMVNTPQVEEATRACLYGILNWFNTDEPFWGDFVPDPDRTVLSTDAFELSLRSARVSLEIRGTVLDGSEPGELKLSLKVGARTEPGPAAPDQWHSVAAAVDQHSRFVTSNFRAAVQASIDDLGPVARG